MFKISAIAQGAMALNLALTGIKVEDVSDAKDAEARCEELLQNGIDVLIIEESLRDAFSERMQDRLKEHTGKPLIVFLPAFDEEDSDVDAYLSSLIKPAVGLEIRMA